MIFTVGKTSVYDPYLRDDPEASKLGRGKDHFGNYFCGGSVWRTRKAAQDYLDKTNQTEFSVYGVLADWETETEQRPNQEWRDLLVTSRLVKLNESILVQDELSRPDTQYADPVVVPEVQSFTGRTAHG